MKCAQPFYGITDPSYLLNESLLNEGVPSVHANLFHLLNPLN